MAKAKTPKLSEAQRAGIVIRFACFFGVAEVRAWLKAEHGVELEPSALSYYNGNNRGAYAQMPEKWQKLFDATREKYYQEEARIPIANRAHRLWVANDLVEAMRAKAVNDRGVNLAIASEIERFLTYAARDRGGAFTNVRVLEHEARGALAKFLGCDPSELPDPDAADPDA